MGISYLLGDNKAESFRLVSHRFFLFPYRNKVEFGSRLREEIAAMKIDGIQRKGQEHFTKFDQADDDFDPICLKGKYWELIKYKFTDYMNKKK